MQMYKGLFVQECTITMSDRCQTKMMHTTTPPPSSMAMNPDENMLGWPLPELKDDWDQRTSSWMKDMNIDLTTHEKPQNKEAATGQ